ITGNYDGAELARLIRNLPDGVTEFMCHPGFCTDELRGERTRLKESRQKELEALRSPEVRQALKEANCQLVSYAQMEVRR
ncbi:MAG TPA: ChbG/HpnK family deacetylase, partial [Bryobacteraceae bacterium]|nr:ChbG/HpnK family deacetylase [Bryobacteraceae bacterium]